MSVAFSSNPQIPWLGHVYVIGVADKDNLHAPSKIGVSGNITSRLSNLRTASPLEIGPAFVFSLPTLDDARLVEREAHFCFRKYRTRGEWFGVDPYIIINAVESIVALVCYRASGGDEERWWHLCNRAGCPAATMACELSRPEQFRCYNLEEWRP